MSSVLRMGVPFAPHLGTVARRWRMTWRSHKFPGPRGCLKMLQGGIARPVACALNRRDQLSQSAAFLRVSAPISVLSLQCLQSFRLRRTRRGSSFSNQCSIAAASSPRPAWRSSPSCLRRQRPARCRRSSRKRQARCSDSSSRRPKWQAMRRRGRCGSR